MKIDKAYRRDKKYEITRKREISWEDLQNKKREKQRSKIRKNRREI